MGKSLFEVYFLHVEKPVAGFYIVVRRAIWGETI